MPSNCSRICFQPSSSVARCSGVIWSNSLRISATWISKPARCLAKNRVGGLLFRQRIGAVGLAVIGVAALEVVALDEGARERQREVDQRDARGRRHRDERRGLAGDRHGVGHERIEDGFLRAALTDAERGEVILRGRRRRPMTQTNAAMAEKRIAERIYRRSTFFGFAVRLRNPAAPLILYVDALGNPPSWHECTPDAGDASDRIAAHQIHGALIGCRECDATQRSRACHFQRR